MLASFDDEESGSDLPHIHLSERLQGRPVQSLRFWKEKLLQKERWEYEMNDQLQTFKPNIVHCHFGPTGILFNKLSSHFSLKTPYVVSFYGYDAFLYPAKYATYRKELDLLFRDPFAYFFVEGPSFRKQLEKLGAPISKILLNPLIIDSKSLLKRKNNTDKTISFLMIGRFTEKKGFHLGLESLGKLKNELSPFEVHIIGYGALEASYMRIVKKYNMEDRVFFKGKLSHEKVKEELTMHDFFLHPSLTASDGDSEGGAPTIIIEAQAAGLPVIASDHADIPYVMGYENFMSKENDLESLMKVIKKAVSIKDLDPIIQKGISHVSHQHDMITSPVYASNIQEIINSFESKR